MYRWDNYNKDMIKYSKDKMDEVLYMYGVGHSISDIQRKTGIKHHNTILRHLRLNGLYGKIEYKFGHDVFGLYTPASCYWAGFIAADGCVTSKNGYKYVSVKLKSDDEQHLLKLCRFVKKEQRVVRVKEYIKQTNRFYDESRISFGSKELIRDLRDNFNITERKSLTIKPPANIPDNCTRHYIRGFMDGDGSISFKRFNYATIRLHFVSGSKDMIEWIAKNIKTNTTAGNPNIMSRMMKSRIFEVEFSGKGANNALTWLYAGTDDEIRLSRKYERFILHNKALINK